MSCITAVLLHRSVVFCLSVCWGLFAGVCLHSAEDQTVYDLSQVDTAPVGGQWQRLLDGQVIELKQGQPLADLALGAYRLNEQVLCLRAGNTDAPIAAHARSLIGLPSSAEVNKDQVITWAEQRERLNPVSLIVLSWRLGDDFEWLGRTKVF